MPTVEFNDDKPALAYIRKRGYASYSSIKNVKECRVPTPFVEEVWHIFGKEHHARLLEKKHLKILSAKEESDLQAMMDTINTNAIVKRLLYNSINEIAFGPAWVLKKFKQSGIVVPDIYGLPVYGRIDILNTTNQSDLKTTKLTNLAAFVKSIEFLQAATYLKAVPRKDFYFIGQSKVKPFTVMPFNVNHYPKRLKEAKEELKRLCIYIKKEL